MKSALLLVGLLVAAPAFAQEARVYTNADLGTPLAPTLTTTPAEAAAILAPHQFVSPPPPSLGPRVYIMGSSSTDGPFGAFYRDAPRRLDGSSYVDPPLLYGSPVWGLALGGAPHGRQWGSRGEPTRGVGGRRGR